MEYCRWQIPKRIIGFLIHALLAIIQSDYDQAWDIFLYVHPLETYILTFLCNAYSFHSCSLCTDSFGGTKATKAPEAACLRCATSGENQKRNQWNIPATLKRKLWTSLPRTTSWAQYKLLWLSSQVQEALITVPLSYINLIWSKLFAVTHCAFIISILLDLLNSTILKLCVCVCDLYLLYYQMDLVCVLKPEHSSWHQVDFMFCPWSWNENGFINLIFYCSFFVIKLHYKPKKSGQKQKALFKSI